MRQLVLKAPAKVNLYLDVLRRRPDGYHDIETIFEKIALFDTITIRYSPDKKIRVTTDLPGLTAGKDNLAYKAAEAIFRKAGFKGGVLIDIKKRIPVAAGLGGGSSDAASTLMGINRFFKLGLNKGQLVSLARPIGADVAFFLHDCSFAEGTSRGDRIRPIANTNNISIWHIIVSFNFGISAASAYNGVSRNLGLTPRGRSAKILSRFRLENTVENLGISLYNKLEGFVLREYMAVAAVKNTLLAEGACGALVSGSGPTVFGITKTREEAIAVSRRVRKRIAGFADRILIASTL